MEKNAGSSEDSNEAMGQKGAWRGSKSTTGAKELEQYGHEGVWD